MISILIPVYNAVVIDLVHALQYQCEELQIPFEIICLDDFSEVHIRQKNASVGELQGVRYKELPANIGRSRIRNRLAEMARYPYLLFMDGDSRIARPDYLHTYLRVLDPETVIYGGRVYAEETPGEDIYRLHWHYGHQREALSPDRRRTHPYRTFLTNNFVIPRRLALQIRFDESIRRYGYEDTLYALALREAGYPILHLDNPLEHTGLEKRPVFLKKVEAALDNLQELLPEYPEIDTRLLQLVRRLEAYRLLGPVRLVGRVFRPLLKWQLLRSSNPPLWLLDLYKLSYFLQ